MPKFTDGEWHVGQSVGLGSGQLVYDKEGELVANCMTFRRQASEIHANAKLIAQAPTLYNALENLIDALEQPDARLIAQCKKDALQALSVARGEV